MRDEFMLDHLVKTQGAQLLPLSISYMDSYVTPLRDAIVSRSWPMVEKVLECIPEAESLAGGHILRNAFSLGLCESSVAIAKLMQERFHLATYASLEEVIEGRFNVDMFEWLLSL